MDMTRIIGQLAILFIILAIGFIANKTKIMTAESNKLVTKLVLNIAVPGIILSSVMDDSVEMTGSDAMMFLLFSLIAFAIAYLLAYIVVPIMRPEKSDMGIYEFMVAYGNVAFMGFPVAQTVFGSQAVFYVALFNIPFSVLSFSAGIVMIAGKGKSGGFNKKLLLNPPLIAGVLAVILFMLDIKVPSVISGTASLLGGMTTPAAMLVIGSTLATIPIKEVFSQWRVYVVSAVRLIVVPVVTWLVMGLFVKDELMLGVLTVLAAMPIATNATMLSMEYGGNDRLASKGVFLSTLFSIVTIPVIVYLFLS